MVDFISLEEAADQLDIPESLLRQWVKKGFARASRRGGSYVLRTTEVERLLNTPSDTSPSMEGEYAAASPRVVRKPDEGAEDTPGAEAPNPSPKTEDSTPQRPRALPPRPRSEELWPSQERRKKLGRRGSDFSLDSLHTEVRQAVEEALEILDGRIDRFQHSLDQTMVGHQESIGVHADRHEEQLSRLEKLAENLQRIPAPAPAAIAPVGVPLEEAEALQQRLQHLEQVREDFRSRLEESETRRQQTEQQLQESEKQLQLKEQELQESEKRRLLSEDELQSRAQDWDGTLDSRGQEWENALRQISERDELVRNLEDSLQREQKRCDDIEETLQKNQEALRQSRAENERLQAATQDHDTLSQEHARQLEGLSAEIAQLRETRQRSEDARRMVEDQLQHSNDRLEQAEERALELDHAGNLARLRIQELEASLQAPRPREEELAQEVKRWKEQVNSLQFKLQMQGQGASSNSVEDSRKQMERLAEMEAQMHEKDRLMNQSYRELSELRSKLEEQQREFYELQQHTDKEKEEWSQVVAQQVRVAGETNQRQNQQAPPSAPQEKGRWGLFKLRGDGQ